jgi:hypothetical protein
MHPFMPRNTKRPHAVVSSTYNSPTSMIRRRTPIPLFQAHVTWRYVVKALNRNNR